MADSYNYIKKQGRFVARTTDPLLVFHAPVATDGSKGVSTSGNVPGDAISFRVAVNPEIPITQFADIGGGETRVTIANESFPGSTLIIRPDDDNTDSNAFAGAHTITARTATTIDITLAYPIGTDPFSPSANTVYGRVSSNTNYWVSATLGHPGPTEAIEADLNSIGSTVNTSGKRAYKQVVVTDATPVKFVFALTAAAGGTWRNMDGTLAYTPV